jgi:hypothetical protein
MLFKLLEGANTISLSPLTNWEARFGLSDQFGSLIWLLSLLSSLHEATYTISSLIWRLVAALRCCVFFPNKVF